MSAVRDLIRANEKVRHAHDARDCSPEPHELWERTMRQDHMGQVKGVELLR